MSQEIEASTTLIFFSCTYAIIYPNVSITIDVINCLQNGATKPLVMTQAMKSHLIHISVWGIKRWRAQRGGEVKKGSELSCEREHLILNSKAPLVTDVQNEMKTTSKHGRKSWKQGVQGHQAHQVHLKLPMGIRLCTKSISSSGIALIVGWIQVI